MNRLVTLTAALSAAHILIGCAADGAEPDHDFVEQAIVGGQSAASGQFPSIVSLRDGYGHFCGGSLIAPGWVLTAGHCVDQGFRGGVDEVVANSLELSDAGEHLKVFRAYRHPEYSEGELFPENDVALLRLASTSTAIPTRLASASDLRWFWPGTRVQVAGWGDTTEDGEQSLSLQFTEVPLVAHRECKRVYGNFLPETTLCAGFSGGGHDACQGDSGGPLFAKIGGKQMQVGVVSAGIGCGKDHWYRLYSGVTNFSSWIADTIAQGDRDAAAQSACIAQCDADFPCEQSEEESRCRPPLDRCLCACANDQNDLCALGQNDADENVAVSPQPGPEPAEPPPAEAPPV